MKKKILWLTRTAAMLALLIALQAVTKPLGQFVTGTCVNAVLAVTCLTVGLSGGLTVALLSPVFAFLLSIAPNAVTVPAIMAGNTVFTLLLHFLCRKGILRRILGLLAAAVAKFAVLYALVVWVICGPAAAKLLEIGVMKAPMLKMLPATFSWPQLVTALAGGALALLIVPVLKKAIK